MCIRDRADSALYGWGSEEWVHDSQLLVAEATQRSMGVSMTSGTNWSNANLTTITPDDKAAAKELNYVTELVKAGKTRSGEIPVSYTHLSYFICTNYTWIFFVNGLVYEQMI